MILYFTFKTLRDNNPIYRSLECRDLNIQNVIDLLKIKHFILILV